MSFVVIVRCVCRMPEKVVMFLVGCRVFPCRLIAIAFPLAASLAVTAAAFAQTTGATLTGVVSDESGAAVAGVELTLAEFSRGVQRVATSDGQGAYVFAGVPAGTYVLTGGSGAFAPV